MVQRAFLSAPADRFWLWSLQTAIRALPAATFPDAPLVVADGRWTAWWVQRLRRIRTTMGLPNVAAVRNVVVVPGLQVIWQPERNRLERLPGTNLWHRTWRVRRDLRTTYCFSLDDPLRALHELDVEEEARYLA